MRGDRCTTENYQDLRGYPPTPLTKQRLRGLPGCKHALGRIEVGDSPCVSPNYLGIIATDAG